MTIYGPDLKDGRCYRMIYGDDRWWEGIVFRCIQIHMDNDMLSCNQEIIWSPKEIREPGAWALLDTDEYEELTEEEAQMYAMRGDSAIIHKD